MVPSRRGLSMVIGGGTKEWRSIAPSLLLSVPFLCREVNSPFKDSSEWEMVGRSPLSREGSREGCHYSRCGGGRVAGGSGKEAWEVQSPRGGGENPGERWFNLENSYAERCSLLRLKRELDASLIFEHGGGQRASQLWVTRILLGRLFRERLVLGRGVKMYAKI